MQNKARNQPGDVSPLFLHRPVGLFWNTKHLQDLVKVGEGNQGRGGVGATQVERSTKEL